MARAALAVRCLYRNLAQRGVELREQRLALVHVEHQLPVHPSGQARHLLARRTPNSLQPSCGLFWGSLLCRLPTRVMTFFEAVAIRDKLKQRGDIVATLGGRCVL
jgi:hypothetical protein